MGREKSTTKPLALREREVLEVVRPIEELLEGAEELAQSALSQNTKRAYEADLIAWQKFARLHNLTVFPIQSAFLAAYIKAMQEQGLRLSTIRRRCIALSKWHRLQNQQSPIDGKVEAVLQGLARSLGEAVEKKRALTVNLLRKILTLSLSPRDQAILLVGFWTGMRRSELAALRWSDLKSHDKGLILCVPFSKTDQTGKGQMKGLLRLSQLDVDMEWCPVQALERLQKQTKTEVVFGCSAKTIARTVKRHLKAIGENPDEFGAHSFRHGFVTETQRGGASIFDTMRQTGHKSEKVVRGYMEGQQAMDNPALVALAALVKTLEGDVEET